MSQLKQNYTPINVFPLYFLWLTCDLLRWIPAKDQRRLYQAFLKRIGSLQGALEAISWIICLTRSLCRTAGQDLHSNPSFHFPFPPLWYLDCHEDKHLVNNVSGREVQRRERQKQRQTMKKTLFKCDFCQVIVLKPLHGDSVVNKRCALCSFHFVCEQRTAVRWLLELKTHRINPPEGPLWTLTAPDEKELKKPRVWFKNVPALPNFPSCFCPPAESQQCRFSLICWMFQMYGERWWVDID